MTKNAYLIAILFLLLASCTADTQPITPSVGSPTQTISPQPLSQDQLYTKTASPSNTATPSLTTTFDPHNIQTVTPSTPEVCPILEYNSEPPPLDIDKLFMSNVEIMNDYILDYLNKYGVEAMSQMVNENSRFAVIDLTNDGNPELVYADDNGMTFTVFGCQGGEYKIILGFPADAIAFRGRILAINDGNRNGIPEIAFNTGYYSQGGHYYRVFEWDGTQFQNIFFLYVNSTGELTFTDIDNDGVQEIIINNGVPYWGLVYIEFGPWRNTTSTYKWKGSQYVLVQEECDPPEFRFQAVQDGDRLFLAGDYDNALAFYQQAITSENLKWWSSELRYYLIQEYLFDFGWVESIPDYPAEDKNEYISLSAYSYFRIMLIYLTKNQEANARGIYDLIQSKYTSEPYGRIYSEMTNAFWGEYIANQDIAFACQKAISYAKDYQNEILRYLGNTSLDFFYSIPHGDQSLEYKPESICPKK